MHENAARSLKGKIRKCLDNSSLIKSEPFLDVPDEKLKPYSDEVVKLKSKWMDEIDAYIVFYSKVNQRVRMEVASEIKAIRPGLLTDSLGSDVVSEIMEDIFQYISSVPRIVDVYFPLNNAPTQFPAHVELSGKASIECYVADENPHKSEPAEPKANPAGDKRSAFLRVAIECCPSYMYESHFMREALLICKCFLQFGFSQKLLEIDTERHNAGFLGLIEYKAPVLSANFIDENPNPLDFGSVVFPFEVSRFFSQVSIVSSSKAVVDVCSGVGMSAVLSSKLANTVALVESVEEGAQRVRAAGYWSIDSRITENRTLAFIQVCIGFEALFGEGLEGSAVTATLADRCAYVLAQKISDRNLIRTRFRSLYKVRSKLVHGNSLELSSKERHLLDWGRSVLDLSVSVECEKINGKEI